MRSSIGSWTRFKARLGARRIKDSLHKVLLPLLLHTTINAIKDSSLYNDVSTETIESPSGSILIKTIFNPRVLLRVS